MELALKGAMRFLPPGTTAAKDKYYKTGSRFVSQLPETLLQAREET
jgi:hypothetical protein